MAKTCDLTTAQKPQEFLGRLAETTVAREEIVNLKNLLSGAGTFLRESLVGKKEFVAQIEGPRFTITTIGIRPFKGRSWTAPLGAMYGLVQPLESGAKIIARFRIYPAIPALLVALLLLAVFGGAILSWLVFSDPAVEPADKVSLLLFIAGAVAALLAMLGWVWWMAHGQARAIAALLGQVAAGQNEAAPAPGR